MNLRARIILTALVVVALVNISSVVYFVERERRSAVTRLRDTIQEDARLLQIVTAGPLYDGNVGQLNATLDSIFANHDILEIELRENRGDIAIARKRPNGAQRGEHIRREIPIARGRDELGTVRITYTTGNIEQRLKESRDAVVRFSILLMACMSVVIYLLATRLTRPIERLTAAAREIAEGDLQRDIDARGGGELTILGQSFVRMRDAVREKISDLAEKNRQLHEQIQERAKAEEAQRQNDARLQLALKASGSGIFEHDHLTDTVYWSPEIRKIYGWRADEAVTIRTLAAGIATEDRERVLATSQAAHDPAGDGAFDCEYRFLGNDGRERWISVRSQTVFAGEGAERRAVRTVGAALDISTHKQQEKALRESEARISEAYEILNDAIENAPAAIALFDAEDQLTAWNSMYKETFFAFNRGLVRRGTDFRTMLKEFQDSGQVRTPKREGDAWLEERILQHRSPSGIGELELHNGRWFQVRETLSRTGRITSVYTDITALKERESDLRASEAKILEAYATLDDAIESAPSAIAIYDAEDKLVAFNSRFKAFFAFHEALVRPGMDFATLVREFTESGQIAWPQRQRQGWAEERQRMHRDPRDPIEINLTNGRWLLITETRARGGGIVTVYNDITALKAREKELQRLNEELEHKVAERTTDLATANKELEAFAYSVSHDLRAPLRGIDGFSQVLVSQHGDKLDAEALRLLQRIRAGAQHMGHLITELLGLSRVARTTVQSAEVDLSALVQSVVDESKTEAAGRRAEWRIQPGMQVHADAGLLRIALVNLLGNALKYTRNTSPARIEVGASRRVGNFLEVYVRDNGAGFDMAYAERLFQPFQRLHAEHEFEGTGIGLATVQRVIAKHGGAIRGEGRVGEGATFYFTIPA
ncbi:MAG: PAS-domain containing protein [Burkholderiales bacterium]|nr:PAS-domain containing protein [Burkholderiales bacterium]